MNSTIDWYGSTRLGDGIVSIRSSANAPPSHSFLVHSDREGILIDTGRGVGDLLGYLETAFATPDHVLLTHSHWDHIGNAHQFDEVVIHPTERTPGGEVTIDGLSGEFVRRPEQFVADRREQGLSFPDGFEPHDFSIPPARDVGTVEEGDEIDIGGKVLEVYEIPGHSPGQIAVLDRDGSVLFGADIVHVGKGIFTLFEDSNFDAYIESLEKVIALRDSGGFETLVTAHNDPIRENDLRILDELLAGLHSIDAGERDHETVMTPWGEAWQFFVGDSKVLTKPGLR